jgi:hypothetical protein
MNKIRITIIIVVIITIMINDNNDNNNMIYGIPASQPISRAKKREKG